MADIDKAKKALSKEQVTFGTELTKAFAKASHLVLDPQRLISVVYSQFQRNRELSKCTIPSVVTAVLACAELGLEPGAKAYLIPYRNNKNGGVLECHFQVGYKGLIDLYYRHPKAQKIEVHAVDEGDILDFEYGSNARLIHKPGEKTGTVKAYYALAKMNGEVIFHVMFPDEIRKHGLRYSKMIDRETGDFKHNSLWKTNFDDMAKKTVLIQLMKTLPYVSAEISHALEADRVSRQYDDRQKSVFDMPKEEDIIETEGEDITDKGEATAGKPEIPPPAAPLTKAKGEIEKVHKTAAEKKLDEEEAKKTSRLNFLIALAKNKGETVNEEAYKMMHIDDAIADLEKVTASKELF